MGRYRRPRRDPRGASRDAKGAEVAPKSAAGRRTVPIAGALRGHLAAHREAAGDPGDDALVFGRTPTAPFTPSAVTQRARKAWKAAKLRPIGLHECRHTFASLMIASGANAKALSTYLGHASISTTYDRYGKLMPGNEAEAAGLLDRYLRIGTGLGQSDPGSSGLQRSQAGNGAAPDRAARATETAQ